MTDKTIRQAAEIIEAFAAEMTAVIKRFDQSCKGMDDDLMMRICRVPHQDVMDTIVEGFEQLANALHNEADAAEEAEDRRRDHPLERDFRRLGQ